MFPELVINSNFAEHDLEFLTILLLPSKLVNAGEHCHA